MLETNTAVSQQNYLQETAFFKQEEAGVDQLAVALETLAVAPRATRSSLHFSQPLVDVGRVMQVARNRNRVVEFKEFSARESELCEKYKRVVGVDEVGTGSWAGPALVVACYVPNHLKIPFLDDSKKLTEAQQERIVDNLPEDVEHEFEIIQKDEIDRIGVGKATQLAMQRAVKRLGADYVVVDGVRAFPADVPVETFVGADRHFKRVALASVIAKVYCDLYMKTLHESRPEYGFEKNKGFGTKAHQNALKTYGISPHHRESFKPIQAFIQQAEKACA